MDQRRFSLRNLRDFGFGKQTMEHMIQETTSDFIQELKKKLGTPIDLHERFSIVVVSALWRIAAGEKLSQNDPKILELLDKLKV